MRKVLLAAYFVTLAAAFGVFLFWPTPGATQVTIAPAGTVTYPVGTYRSVSAALEIKLYCRLDDKRAWTPCPDIKSGREWQGEIDSKDPGVALLMQESGIDSQFRMTPTWKDECGDVPPAEPKDPKRPCRRDDDPIRLQGTPLAECRPPKDPKHPEIPECKKD